MVVDPSSPTATLALGELGEPALLRELPQKQTSERLLATIDEMLGERGISLSELGGLVAVRGPGSFTGLRIGLATLYGLHQASGTPTAAVSTLEALACAAPGSGRVLALVDALRGEWFAQSFERGEDTWPVPAAPRIEPEILPADAIEALPVDDWVAHSHPEIETERRRHEPKHLAGAVLERITPEALRWDPSSCLHPLYLRAPAVTLPKAKGPQSIG